MSIKLEHISKRYGEQWALKDIHLSIRQGNITGLLGPNGAGKSTMLKIISGYIPPTKGVATVNEIDVMQQPLEVKKNIGYLPEHNPLYLDMYVREYLYYIAGVYHIKGNIKTHIDQVIERTGLTVEQNKKLSALSKGYRQRVGMAQALLHNPDVLILDEPTTGLDPNQIIEIRELIKEVGKEKTVLLSTHIMQEVEAICDQVIILNKGEVVAQGSTQEVKTMMQSADTKYIKVEFDKAIDTKALRDIRQALFAWAVEHNLSILSMSQQENSMEDVFRSLTAR
ncbi:MAG: gliding motility-associated ABC transporter ATP-binding subunit GldA [Bacteroidia bacterium]|nr:MAG: gliding motility-associated ABC transporter ATP-binding subunit GldA [Bacteroidia bacterium]